MASAAFLTTLAQLPTDAGPSATTIFYVTLLLIFVTAIVTAVVTKWSRDKCLKFFHDYHVTLERFRGQTIWGKLRVFSSGVEVVYDSPFIDARGRRKTSYMIYQQEIEPQVLSILRYHDELDDVQQRRRTKQVHQTFNPGPLRRAWRGVRNFVNTLRDAFNSAIGTAVGQFQRMNPANALITTGAGSVTQIGQTLLGKFAGNAYEPMLEQYIGQPVILDVADPLNPNNATVEYTGYLGDYSASYIAIFNVDHVTVEELTLPLPDVERGDRLPPLPPPPPPGAPPVTLPPPILESKQLAIRLDGLRMRVQNTGHQPLVVRRLEREGYEPLTFGTIIPPQGSLDLPARDARSAKLFIEVVHCLDVLAPRKWCTIRHAGQLVERRRLSDEMNLNQLNLVPRLFRSGGGDGGSGHGGGGSSVAPPTPTATADRDGNGAAPL